MSVPTTNENDNPKEQQQEQESARFHGKLTNQEVARLRLLVQQCACYVAVMFVTWPFLTLAHMTSERFSEDPAEDDQYFSWWMIVAILTPLQGFWNGLVFWRFQTLRSRLEASQRQASALPAATATSRRDHQEQLQHEQQQQQRSFPEQAPHQALSAPFDAIAALDGDSTASLAPPNEEGKKKASHVTQTSAGVFQVVQGHEVKELGVQHDDLESVSSVTESFLEDDDDDDSSKNMNSSWVEKGMPPPPAEATHPMPPFPAPVDPYDTPSLENASHPATLNSGSVPTHQSSILQRKGQSAYDLENSLTDQGTATPMMGEDAL
uniref:Uncharacterized protein n=1 Tax=Entomoneis paludosa TaxID=265537 RepID=A0A7S2YBY7_9STRA|mmetsp:Transcript_26599/g.55677  ORF Transcript_26599/g.55677 Transcript_26599/m.55677 type:complete len:322 (+) Transcript_26599:1307-2272(+)